MKNRLQDFVPHILWSALRAATGRAPIVEHQGVTTRHSTLPMRSGAYAAAFARFASLDPHVESKDLQYRLYNVERAAALARDVPGDYLFAGISYGVAPRVVYDAIDFGQLDKVMHLVDPFSGIDRRDSIETRDSYNADESYVRRQYPPGARVRIHRNTIPDALPVAERLAFVHLNTGDRHSEAASIGPLYDALSPGGVMLIDAYGQGAGAFATYDPVVADLPTWWIASGQLAVFRR